MSAGPIQGLVKNSTSFTGLLFRVRSVTSKTAKDDETTKDGQKASEFTHDWQKTKDKRRRKTFRPFSQWRRRLECVVQQQGGYIEHLM